MPQTPDNLSSLPESEKISVQMDFYDDILKEHPESDSYLFLFVREYWKFPELHHKATKLKREHLLEALAIDQTTIEEFFFELSEADIFGCGADFTHYLRERNDAERINQSKHGLSVKTWDLTVAYISGIRDMIPSIKQQLQKIRDQKATTLPSNGFRKKKTIPSVGSRVTKTIS